MAADGRTSLGMRETGPIDVFIATYNSAKHLEECLSSVRRSIPARRIVVVDHHSTDGTIAIARRNGCEVVLEEKGLAYARELSFEMAETEVFAMVESDLVYREYGWFERAASLLTGNVAAVVASVPRTGVGPWKKYSEFWARFTPLRGRRHGFSTGSTLLLTKAVKGIKIPSELRSYEDGYIARALAKRGWTFGWLEVDGVHYADFSDYRKGLWYGANARTLYRIDPTFRALLFRQLTLPVKGAVASLYLGDPRVLGRALILWFATFNGWFNAKKYRVMQR
jgi:glycosyltransferase involved in cell wall biosynthesis